MLDTSEYDLIINDNISIWDKNTPVEKSNYIIKGKVRFINEHSLSNTKDKLTMIDLFCGAGGFSVGAEWAGFYPILGIDHFEPAINTWALNHPKSIACLGDIKNIHAKDIKELLFNKGISKINLITGGVPCQGFSIANRKHNDNDERNFLFLEYMKFVKEFTPDYILLENVQGMRSTAGGKFEHDIKKSMEELGYVVTVKLVNAADYGVPQIRKRLIFMGVRKSKNLDSPYIFPAKIIDNPKNYITVSEAISDLPELGSKEQAIKYNKSSLTEYQKLMKGLGNINIIKPVILSNHISPNHPAETIAKINQTPQGVPMYPKFKQRIRLSESLPSPTQLAGGIRPQFQFGHPTQARGLTIRERARIQSFPDSFIFTGGTVQERVQTGNAVPPLLVYELVKILVKDLKK